MPNQEGQVSPRWIFSRRFLIKYLFALALFLLPFAFFDGGTRMEIMLGDGDTFVHTLPVWTYVGEQWKDLSPPLWTPNIYGGYPLYAEPQTAAFHPSKILFLFFSPLAAVNLTVLFAYSMAGLWVFLLAREEGLTFESSFLAGFSFAFCGYLVGHQAMTGLLVNAAWFPAPFFVLRRLANRTSYGTIGLGALVITLLVLAGHPQLMFYSVFFSLIYAVYLALYGVPQKERRPFLLAAAAMFVLGVIFSAFQWMPTLELSTRTFRENLTYEVFAGPSSSFPTLLTSLISTRLFHLFSDQASEAMLDIGLPVLLLAALALIVARRRSAFWIFLFVFGCILYVGAHTPVYRLMFLIPGYNLFRLPSRNGIAIELALVMLAGHGLTAVQRKASPSSRYLVLGVPVILIVLYYAGVHSMDDRIYTALFSDVMKLRRMLPWTVETLRTSFLPISGLLAVVVVTLSAMGYLLLRWGRHRLTAYAMIVLAFGHFWSYRNWIFTATRDQVNGSLARIGATRPRDGAGFYRTAPAATENWLSFLAKDQKQWHERYAEASGPNFSLLSGDLSVSGYGPLIRRDYSRFAGEMTTSGTFGRVDFFGSRGLDMLGVKKVFVPKDGLGVPESALSSFARDGESEFTVVYKNSGAMPLFWGVKTVEARSRKYFWTRLGSGQIDFSSVAILTDSGAPRLRGQYGLPRVVEVKQVAGNRVELAVESDQPVFLASSQLSYPGWGATIDGQKAALHEINALFLGLEVPPGRHRVLLRFLPGSMLAGLGVAGGALLLLWFARHKNLLRLGSAKRAPQGEGLPEGIAK